MVDAVKGGDLRDMLVVSDEEATEAAIDGLWQAIMLAGIMDRMPMNVEFLSYEAPTYFGMIVAAFEPKS
jgi:aromatic ring-opening dioxygenase LigB subunit